MIHTTVNRIEFVMICVLLCSMYACIDEKEKETEPINIVLYDKPLSVIQDYIAGKWNLDSFSGGIMGGTYVDTTNLYVIFSTDHIIIGDDIRGIVVDTTLFWRKMKISDDSIYVYSHPGSSIYTIVNEIRNSNLITRDYLMDGYMYTYSR